MTMKCVVSFSFSSCLIASAVLFAQVSISLHPHPPPILTGAPFLFLSVAE